MNPRLKSEYYNQIVKESAQLYPTQTPIMSLMKHVGLNLEQANLQGSGENMWDSVVSLAEKDGKLQPLISLISETFPNRQNLITLGEDLRAGTAFIREISYDDFITPPSSNSVKVFLVYDYEDLDVVKPLLIQMMPLQKFNGKVRFFDMHKEKGGGDIAENFFLEKIGESDVVMLLMTPNFMGNPDNDCDPLAFASFQMRKRVIPVLLVDCSWKRIELLQGIVPLPKSGVFVSNSSNKDQARMLIAQGLEEVVQSIKQS